MRIYYNNGSAVQRLQESDLSDNYAETGLPVNIWLDTDASYREEFVGKTIRFQGDYEEAFNPHNLFIMTISRDDPAIFEHQLSKLKLPDDVVDAVRDFVIENARNLEKLADEKITVRMFAMRMKPVEFYEDAREPLLEMAKLKKWDYIPKELVKRTAGRVVDHWFWDEGEDIKDMQKIAFQDSIAGMDEGNFYIKFFYGFISRFHSYAKGGAKASGAKANRRWEFRALHIISNVPGAAGQWMRDDFKDSDFDGMGDYEGNLVKSDLNGKQMVAKIVSDFKLKKCNGNVLKFCNDLMMNINSCEFSETVKEPLLEMAKLENWDHLPEELIKRTARCVADDWFWDRKENLKDMQKLAMESSIGGFDEGDSCIVFYYGFISRFHSYAKGGAKASGARANRRWEFRVLHVVSTIPGAEGQWMRDDFADSDFDGMDAYESALIKKRLSGKQMVAKIVADFNLKKRDGNVLKFCNDLIK